MRLQEEGRGLHRKKTGVAARGKERGSDCSGRLRKPVSMGEDGVTEENKERGQWCRRGDDAEPPMGSGGTKRVYFLGWENSGGCGTLKRKGGGTVMWGAWSTWWRIVGWVLRLGGQRGLYKNKG